jgi:hypothetical protein
LKMHCAVNSDANSSFFNAKLEDFYHLLTRKGIFCLNYAWETAGAPPRTILCLFNNHDRIRALGRGEDISI